MRTNPYILWICGPAASGKSQLSRQIKKAYQHFHLIDEKMPYHAIAKISIDKPTHVLVCAIAAPNENELAALKLMGYDVQILLSSLHLA